MGCLWWWIQWHLSVKMFNHIEPLGNVENDMNNILTEHIAKKLNCDSYVVNMHADSIMYEPTNEVGLHDNSEIDKHEHLNKSPEKLTIYLDAHLHPNKKSCEIIRDDDNILSCKGYDNISVHQCISASVHAYRK